MATRRPMRPGMPEEERLPWLEDSSTPEPARGAGGGPGRLLLVLVGLMVLAAAAGAWWWHGGAAGGDGAGGVIKAPAGPYKVRPREVGGMKVEGQGFSSFSASEGGEPVGALDLSAVPEAPLANPRGAPPKPGAAIEPKTVPAEVVPAAAAGTVIQLGAFSSQAKATAAWKSLSSRFVFLRDLEPLIAAAAVDGGTVYRLRSATPSTAFATQVCGRMRVAGETCLVVR